MILTQLVLVVAVLVAEVVAPHPTMTKAVTVIYGEINSYGSSYGGYPAPSYGGYPAPSSYNSYSSKSYGGYPAPPSYNSYSSKSYGGYPAPSYGSSGYKPSSYGSYPPKSSSYGSYPPPSSSYSSGGRYKRSAYPPPSPYGNYPPPSYGGSYNKPSYGGSYNKPTYGGSYNKPSYGGKQIITGTVKFELDNGNVKYKISLKVNPPSSAGYGYAEEIARSIVVNDFGVDEDLRSTSYGSGSSYATNPYSYSKKNSIDDICSETGDTKYTINDEVEETYGYLSSSGMLSGCSSIEDLIGRSVVVYKDKGDTASSSGSEAIACGTIALTEET